MKYVNFWLVRHINVDSDLCFPPGKVTNGTHDNSMMRFFPSLYIISKYHMHIITSSTFNYFLVGRNELCLLSCIINLIIICLNWDAFRLVIELYCDLPWCIYLDLFSFECWFVIKPFTFSMWISYIVNDTWQRNNLFDICMWFFCNRKCTLYEYVFVHTCMCIVWKF